MQQPRRRRWPWFLGGVALLATIGAIWINAQLEPNRLAATVLGKAGEALQLQLSFRGTPEYAFRPEPRLVLPGFSAASLDGKVFLSARRAEISLPWSTITGDEPVITRIQLDAPVLDVAGLNSWLASRPPSPFKLPTLVKGLSVSDGTIVAESWSLRKLALELPHLKSGDPAKLDARGEFIRAESTQPFQLETMFATPSLASDFDLKLVLIPLAEAPKAAAPDTAPKPKKPAPISIALAGRYDWADPRFTLDANKLALVANSPLPSFVGKGKFETAGDTASLAFDAVLSRWPEAWPTLPPLLAARSEKLPVQLSYGGKRDFSDALTLVAAREDTELRATLRVPEMQQWLASEHASPLPPLRATLKTPSLDFDGIELEGVEVEISEGSATGAVP